MVVPRNRTTATWPPNPCAIVSEALPAPARKYVPFDRSHDRVEAVAETPEGRAEYERARGEYAKIIAETAERLRRLYPPSHTKVKVNAEQGRLDPRHAEGQLELLEHVLVLAGVHRHLVHG